MNQKLAQRGGKPGVIGRAENRPRALQEELRPLELERSCRRKRVRAFRLVRARWLPTCIECSLIHRLSVRGVFLNPLHAPPT
jgi:hypothetical protein